MPNPLYALRRRLGQCVRCGHRTTASLCDPCRTAINTRTRERRWAQQQHRGPNVLYCCGQAHPITTMPFTTPCCGKVMFGDRGKRP